ncbi:MAG: phytanoyl-CoA dioxygenase family protein [Planctomycetota bacterium]|nr:MAG: phytanoyl-CoA dioxygenase family protein [Planctomycetota bacterium]REK24412.1 MAG: phytanoyl-CoA dioxygenase family protein [Planctomycetota bacterium]REK38600.1 MAG: phytanoyl-CoA dioxygenase family protein [Planctomycetota bacterium]
MTTDLSTRHEPVGDLLDSTGGDPEAYRLSDKQVRSFHEWGYVAGVPILDGRQIDLLREELAELAKTDHPGYPLWYEFHSNESADPSKVLFHALGAWRIGKGCHDILWHPAMTVPASQLLGGSVRFWHDQLFCKPARHGGVVAWHQDYSYWTRTRPMAHLTCWIGLDDTDEENGCMWYVPGSHKWDLLPITGLAGDMNAIREALSDEQWEALQNPAPVVLKAGEASFHHPLMIHGSRENLTDRQRRAVVINLCRADVCSDSDEPLLDGVPVVPKGERLGGQFFPLLRECDGGRSA